MSPELDHALRRDFPAVFPEGRYTPFGQRGFEIGNGWEPIARLLATRLQAIGGVSVAQIKEKFGTLRVYLDFAEGLSKEHAAAALEAVDVAEQASRAVCDTCGAPGKLITGGWLRTLCEACKASRGR